MRNVIKMSQYGSLVNLPSYLKPTTDLGNANEKKQIDADGQSEVKLKQTDSAKLDTEKPNSDETQFSRGALGDAFDKAKEIIEAAEAYKVSAIKEATEKMNEECSKLKIKSREEGFALGKLEGRKQGEEEGYKLGYSDGLEKAERENLLIVNELERLIDDVQQAKKAVAKKYEDDLQNIAVAIAKKIVKTELETNPKAISSIIKKAVEDYHNQEWMTITVSENTAEKLEEYDKNIIDDLKGVSGNVKIVASAQAEDGDCFIEMPDLAIDASVDTQFSAIEKAIE
ncbi:MAG: hypothetical protein K5917_07930 [Clostridiales bacterium]|nr:hypothetical protein [Clostridiales bacterium]